MLKLTEANHHSGGHVSKGKVIAVNPDHIVTMTETNRNPYGGDTIIRTLLVFSKSNIEVIESIDTIIELLKKE